MLSLRSQLAAATSPPAAVRVARSIAAALHRLHRRGIVHGEVRPELVIFDDSRGEWILGPPTVRGSSAPALDGPRHLAPEQVRDPAAVPDERSDLYALGLILFELLTGKSSFAAPDALGLHHAHAALDPIWPHELVPAVPVVLSQITLKLMAKSVEHRYQTAHGVLHDLERCRQGLEESNAPPSFPLGERDIPRRLRRSRKLYERDDAQALLLQAFTRVHQRGAAEVVLVSGVAGVGKSVLARAFEASLAPRQACFASGEGDSLRRDEPYRAFRQLLGELVHQRLTVSDHMLGALRETLRHSLGDNAQVVCDLVPDLALLIGEQPAVSELPPADARGRLHTLVRRFLSVLASRDQPLVLFIDDAHWADDASIGLLHHLVLEPTPAPLLFVIAYRCEEVGGDSRLDALLEELHRGAAVTELTLPPLSKCALGAFIHHLLSNAPLDGTVRGAPPPSEAGYEGAQVSERKLLEIIHDKTLGNPLFAIQLADTLVERGHIRFDPDIWAWRCDMEQISAEPPADNVVAVIAARLLRAPAETRALVIQAACLGSQVVVEPLAALADVAPTRVREQLQGLARDGILTAVADAFRFSHERIRDAALGLASAHQRGEIHLAIARQLLAELPASELPRRAFELADHLRFVVSPSVASHRALRRL